MTWCKSIAGLTVAAMTTAALPQTSQPVGGYGPPREICTLEDPRITEASGIVASRRNPGLYYVHNDSGDAPLVYLVDRAGRTRGTIRLTNARNLDWEDIAMAPRAAPASSPSSFAHEPAGEDSVSGPDGNSQAFDVCVADIGDNSARREELTIYRFPEIEAAVSGTTVDLVAATYRIRCSGGPTDAEGFAVHPRTGDGYVLTKRLDGRCDVYKLPAPWDPTRVTILPKVATLRFPDAIPLATMVTAADISPDGRRLAARSYICGWEWRLPAGSPATEFDPIFNAEPVRLTLAAEPQSEGLCYSADGRAILTISEKRPTVLHEVSLESSPDSRRD